MNTEKLFYHDSHKKTFTAQVLSCQPGPKDTWLIVLDQTAFFPEGGGQYADTGYLENAKVLDVQEKDGILYHQTDQPLTEGCEVTGNLDYEERFSKMQQHTGEHIVSGLMHSTFGYDNVGFHLGTGEVTMDFNGPVDEGQLRAIELRANQAVAANLPVEVTYPSREELGAIEYRSKIEIQGQVRIVTIPGYDVCACCAPHVKTTGEIGMIKLTGAVKYKGGTRVSMLCGFRALDDYNQKEESVRKISILFSAKPELVAAAASKQKEDLATVRDKLLAFQEKYLSFRLQQLSASQNIYIFEEELDVNIARRFVNQAMEQCSGIAAVFIGNDQNGYRYILGSRSADLNTFSRSLNSRFHGKGGGKPEMVQGSLAAGSDSDEIVAFLQQ